MLSGRLDTTTSPQLEAEFKSSLNGITELKLDFKDLEYLSSAGLRVLLAAQKVMNKQGKMTIFNVNETINEVFGTADKILDFFLRRKRVLAKYTKEKKQKAIDLYIRYCKQATKVIKELGYPNERHTLVSWYRGYEEKGEVKDDYR